MSKNQEYAARYAELAKTQMQKYGIPASVILAQGILESANGESQLARKENNHFGIKASPSWLAQGGKYGIYTDDSPDEKFCAYDSVGDSFEHHSRILAENSRYAECFKLAPDDYRGWTRGLENAGYASGKDYAVRLQQIIERNGLAEYDREVMDMGRMQDVSETESNRNTLDAVPGKEGDKSFYSLPLSREKFLVVTTPFGTMGDSGGPDKGTFHKGMDIKCGKEYALAMESNGRVVEVRNGTPVSEGRSVVIEYERPDHTRLLVEYSHLEKLSVGMGDTVVAGQRIGMVGAGRDQSISPHLHLQIKSVHPDGTEREMDPAAYIAEIAHKGDISVEALYNGRDLLAEYQQKATANPEELQLSPDEWMKKLLSSEDGGMGLSANGDPVMELVTKAFSSLMLLAVKIDGRTECGQKQQITESLEKKKIDLSSLLPGLKNCIMTVDASGRAELSVNDGDHTVNHRLSSQELSRLSLLLNDVHLTDDVRKMRVAGLLDSMVLSEFASLNFEEGMRREHAQEQSIQR